MPGSIQNRWTYAVTIVNLARGETSLATGSAFYWAVGDRTFLVTNWHNLSGRDPMTQQPMSPTSGLPDHVEFLVYRRTTEPDDQDSFSMEVSQASVALYEDGDEQRPRWFEHPTHHRAVDVAAIDVTDELNSGRIHFKTANALDGDADVQPQVSQDAFVVGYPLGITTGLPVPVWKRASIATEPSLDANNLPCLLVDTATREGMSGSLVLARHVILGPFKKKDGSMASQSMYAVRDQILGVYSGRLGDDQVKAQLGIVWKRQLIDEVVNGCCRGQVGMD
jgi:hypothetical protein